MRITVEFDEVNQLEVSILGMIAKNNGGVLDASVALGALARAILFLMAVYPDCRREIASELERHIPEMLAKTIAAEGQEAASARQAN